MICLFFPFLVSFLKFLDNGMDVTVISDNVIMMGFLICVACSSFGFLMKRCYTFG